MISILPYLQAIEVRDDRVLIRSECYDVERTVYTDGRGHPPDGERTIQGHSIGRREGATLVVDTRLFADYRVGHGRGVPSGAQKHTVERFALGADGTAIDVEIWVEDPEFVVDPYTISTTWAYAPGRELQPFDCDPENARVYRSPEGGAGPARAQQGRRTTEALASDSASLPRARIGFRYRLRA